MKELKQVEYPDIQLIAEGTGKILRFGNRANQEKLGPRRVKKHQGPESRPELNLSKKGKQRHFSNCKVLKMDLMAQGEPRRERQTEGKIKPAICHLG